MAVTTVTLEAPEAVLFFDAATERDARLLVAGEYPQKRLAVTEADLDALVRNFSGPVPVKVEHIDSPLDPLGLVRTVWRDGPALMGRVRFSADMASFLSRRGAHKLSVGLLPAPDWRLLEASLTLRPHVAGATLLSETLLSESLLSGELLSEGEAGELVRLRAERLDGQMASLKASGRLVPAAEPFARALLAAASVVTLSDGASAPVGDTFRRFLEAQPVVVRLGELAKARARVTLTGGPSGAAASTEEGMSEGGMPEEEMPEFSAADREVLRRLGVAPADVARTMAADRGRGT